MLLSSFLLRCLFFFFFLISLQRKRNCFWCNILEFSRQRLQRWWNSPSEPILSRTPAGGSGREGGRSCSWEYKILMKNLGHKQVSNNVTVHKAFPRNLMNSQLWRTFFLKQKQKQKKNSTEMRASSAKRLALNFHKNLQSSIPLPLSILCFKMHQLLLDKALICPSFLSASVHF